ncbi:MAG: autotransporter assembly complex family protein [Pseudomonadota bacterium]
MTLPSRLLLLALCTATGAWAQEQPAVSSQPSVEELTRTPVKDAKADAAADSDSTMAGSPAQSTEDGPRVTVDFRITGIGEPELTNAYNWLGFVAEDQRGRLDYTRLKTLHDGAKTSIKKALQPYGFYEPTIESTLTGGPRDYFARYVVNVQQATLWAAADIVVTGDGAADAALVSEITNAAPRVGRRLRHSDYDALKTRALNTLREAGYLDARTTRAELRVDTAQHAAVVALTFDTGRRWRFGPVRFSGSDKIDEDVLRRYVQFETGESFAPQTMLDTQFALNDLDYYSDVQIEPLRDEAQGDQIPLLITLTDNKARRDDYGLGYGTDTGARVTAATEFRRLNSRGHKLRLAVRASQKISGASAEYRIPFGNAPGEFLSFSGAAEQDNLAFGSSRDYRLGAALNRSGGAWKRIYYLRLHRSIFDFTEGEDNAVSLLTPGLSLSRQWLDDPAYARQGLSIFGDLHGAQEGLLSDATFVQVRTVVKGALPFGRRGRVLGRIELGATSVNGFTDLPPDERFFAGGDQSVRGYGYQTIGAGRDDNGGTIGGRYLNVFSVELEQGFRQSAWGAAVFADAGGVGDVPNPRLEYGVGVGARYRAPFGSVTIDVAHPLKAGESPLRLHIGVRVGL